MRRACDQPTLAANPRPRPYVGTHLEIYTLCSCEKANSILLADPHQHPTVTTQVGGVYPISRGVYSIVTTNGIHGLTVTPWHIRGLAAILLCSCLL